MGISVCSDKQYRRRYSTFFSIRSNFIASHETGKNETFEDNSTSNAIRNTDVEKYSRFQSSKEFSVCCNTPKTRLTNGIRDLVYQISPYNIMCAYKKMFETCAVNTLLLLDFGADEQDAEFRGSSPVKIRKSTGNMSEPTTPRATEPLLVNMSNSCVYGSSSEQQGGTKRGPSGDYFCGWQACNCLTAAMCTGHAEKTSMPDEPREPNKRPGKPSCCSAVSPRPAVRAIRQRSARPVHGPCPDLPKSRRGTRERVDESMSATNFSANTYKSPIKIGKHFKHYRRNTSYMDQYREEYTYKRLRDFNRPASVDSLVCTCGTPNCASSRSSPCIPTWYPLRSQQIRVMSVPRDISSSETPISVPRMRTPSFKKQNSLTYFVQTPSKSEQDIKKIDRCSAVLKRETARREFFSTSLTVNNYNPTVKHSVSIARLAAKAQARLQETGNTIEGDQESPDVMSYDNKNEKGT